MRNGLINHIDLTVTDLVASRTFYDKVLGKLGYKGTAEYEGEVPCWVLSLGGSMISIGLHAAKVATPHNRYTVGLHHLAFHLSSRKEIDDFHTFLISENVNVLDAPAEYDYTPGYYAAFFADPDGIKLEVVYEPRFDSPAA